MNPSCVIVTSVARERVRAVATDLRTLAGRHRVALGGAGARDGDAADLGVVVLCGDPVAAAERLTAESAGRGDRAVD